MKIIIVNGFPQSGKDTFVNFCLKELRNFGKSISTVDFVKEIALKCGWNGEKTPKDRKFLSDLKMLLTEWNDVPYKKVVKEIDMFKYDLEYYDVEENGVVFIMCREPREINKLRVALDAKTLIIRRLEVEKREQSNVADSDILNYIYDYQINNDGTLEELQTKAIEFLKNI